MSASTSGQDHNQFRPCRYGLQVNCPFGQRCKFDHKVAEEASQIVASRNTSDHNKSAPRTRSDQQSSGRTRRNNNNVRGRGTKVNQNDRRDTTQTNGRNKGKGVARSAEDVTVPTPNEAPKDTGANNAKALAIQKAEEATEAIKREIERERLEKEMWEKRLAQEKMENEKIEESLREERVRDATVMEQYFVSESSLITCGAGLEVQHIIPGFELCQITIRNLPSDAKADEVEDILIQQGISKSEFFLTSLKKEDRKATQESVILAKAEHGEVLAAGLEGLDFRDSTLSFEVTQNTNFHSDTMGSSSKSHTALTVWWYEPSTTIRATYNSATIAANHQRNMNQKLFRGRRIRAILEEARRPLAFGGIIADVPTSVRLYNLPANTAIDTDLTEFTGTHLMRVLFSGGSIFTNPREIITNHIRHRDGIQIGTMRDMPQDAAKGESKIEVRFDTWENAKAVYDSIDKKKIGGTIFRPWLPRPLQYEIRIPKEQYEAQRGSWNELSERKEGSDAFVQIRIPGGPRQPHVFVRALGTNKKTVGALKVRVESLASGTKLESQTYWHSSFASLNGMSFFQRVKRETGVLVRNDFKTRSLKLYGNATKLDDACRMLKEEADRLREEEVTIQIEPWMARFFVNKGLQELQELLGEDQVRLDITTHRVIVKGGDEATQHANRLIQEARTKGRVASASSSGGGDGDAACAVCTDTASHPELLVCGHTYCKACLKHFLVSAVDGTSFPITCVGDGNTCNRPISIPVIRRFLVPRAFDALVETVFRVYMEKHSEEFKYCTTADCKQIYRHGGEDDVQCPSCFAAFCPKCDEPHEDMSCAQWKAHKDPDGAHEGLGSLGFKKCPNCKVWVDRTEGCNHMTCAKCETHFCWLCLMMFPTGGEVYEHMTTAHGGFWGNGDQPQQGAANVQAGGGGILAALVPADYEQQRLELLRIEQERLRQEAQQEAQQELMRRRLAEHRARIAREEVARAERLRQERVEAARVELIRQEAARRLVLQHAQQQREEELRQQQARNRMSERIRWREEEEGRRAALQRRKEEEGGGWCIVM
ncbi:hypothetical protein BJ165DRAFT_1407775 [Panaeolus papilionaceus]|nr:hypothetical protein BJ165DRAFT_1407775 [Panaeolus papilionaceus]